MSKPRPKAPQPGAPARDTPARAARRARAGASRLRGAAAELNRSRQSLRRAQDALQAQGAQLAEINEALWKSVSEPGFGDAGEAGEGGPGAAAAAAAARVLDDPARLAALRDTALLDTPAEESFDRFTRLAAQTLGVPVCLVSLVDERRQFFKSATGLAEPWASRRETPLSHSFCKHVVSDGEPLVVEDALRDARVRDNGAVRDLGVQAYLGVPLATPGGQVLGSFCAIDTRPHRWSEDDRRVMERIAQSVLASIAVRMQMRALAQRARRRTAEARVLADAIEHSLNAFYMVDAALRFTYANAAYCRLWGCAGPRELLGLEAGAHCADPAQHARIVAALRDSGSCRVEATLRRKDGALVEVLMHAHRVQAEGADPGWAVSAIDITESKRAREAMQASLREKEVLLQEIHHRVKNNLQVVSSLLQLQRRQLQEPALREVFAEAEQRVRAMALVHERLYQGRQLQALDFGDYLRGLVEQLLRSSGAERPPALELALQPLLLPVNTAIPLALIASELVTNALKYAWPGGARGRLRITLRGPVPGRLELQVQDDGPGLPPALDPATAQTLGLRLVQMLAEQVDAAVAFDPGAGTRCRVTVPVAWTLSEAPPPA